MRMPVWVVVPGVRTPHRSLLRSIAGLPLSIAILENFVIGVAGMREDDVRVRALVARIVAALAGATLEDGVAALWFTLRIYVREQVRGGPWVGRGRS